AEPALDITQARINKYHRTAPLEKSLNLGLGYPYASLKYWCFEIKAAYEDGIRVYGGRLYFPQCYKTDSKLSLYAGAEYDLVEFDTEEIKGEGTVFLPFIGGNYRANKDISISVDIGPGYINLVDSEYSDIAAEGWEWIINIGIWIPLSSL
ncbi:hypothetical protein KJ959_03405, partial [bacterium]|nr:hypothetical protein [bacterium]